MGRQRIANLHGRPSNAHHGSALLQFGFVRVGCVTDSLSVCDHIPRGRHIQSSRILAWAARSFANDEHAEHNSQSRPTIPRSAELSARTARFWPFRLFVARKIQLVVIGA
jgi:hypothetical protein